VFSAVASLCTLPIGGWIIGTVALKQIDDAPSAKPGSERNDKGLQGGNGRCEKFHIYVYLRVFLIVLPIGKAEDV